MADTAAPTTSRSSRTATAQRRTGAVSSDTENKLARAAKSAQRLAELSDATRDDSTGDLFSDDPARAVLEAMNIDTRQGTLAGFELPDDVLAAVGMPAAERAETGGEAVASSKAPAAAEAKASRSARGARSSDAAVEAPALEAESRGADRPEAASKALPATAKTPDADAVPKSTAELDAVLAPSSAGVASTIRSVASARRQAAARPSENAASGVTPRANEAEPMPASPGVVAESTVMPGTQPQAAPQSATGSTATSTGAASAPAPEPAPASVQQSAAPAQAKSFARETAPYTPAASRRAPDLDWARATAFADTVDALYGVIADQRRAAGDHSRRMKWLLSIVVAALLVTIAIGITQTALLMRLTRESAAQQQRIEDMLRSQQATLTTLADAAASANTPPPVNETPPSAPATRPTSQAPAVAKHAKPQPHSHKPKAAPMH
ncbi:hypothetical protein FAZ95_37870 [Trinickia violacea]|uniref:Cell wall surface anchor family protein n=1 Tax=Trinickia violacea TaxID=2571746 RepID=A0A4P8IYY9_9BURK|nr:hypothetical protein [Trinickia violacea]QCP54638.1 hypothetical protein FAZ95_37870 [Trinickia violacea]